MLCYNLLKARNREEREMKRKAVGLLSIFFILFLLRLSVCSEGAVFNDKKNFLWKAQSRTGTVYLLGSIHYFKRDLYPLNRKIEEAFERSNILAVEANINDAARLDVLKLMDSAFYPEDENLERHVSGETYELLKKHLGGGIPLELINKQRPWFLALTLASLELMRLGFDPESGIDRHFLSKAEGRKKILELEGLDYQMNLMAGLSEYEQEMLLLYTLKDLRLIDKETDRLLSAWTSGNAKAMEAIVSGSIREDSRISSFYEKLLYERNRAMTSKIEGFLRSKDTYFVVVGAGHLLGDKGIIRILRGKGYLIEQL